MKNMDPELMKSMGITDKAQIDKAAEAMEKMSPETVDRLMSVAVGGQRAYIFYKTHLWFRCLLQLTIMYLLYYFFGGWAMRTVAYFTGSSSTAAAAPLSAGPAGVGGAVNAGEGKAERDWSGKATANLVDEVDDDEVSRCCHCCPRSCATASAISCVCVCVCGCVCVCYSLCYLVCVCVCGCVCVCVCVCVEGGPCFAAGALYCWRCGGAVCQDKRKCRHINISSIFCSVAWRCVRGLIYIVRGHTHTHTHTYRHIYSKRTHIHAF
jgi:hypothetical protein